MEKLLAWLGGLLFSVLVGHWVSSKTVNHFRTKDREPPSDYTARTLGGLERGLYSSCYVIGLETLIGLYLIAKMAGRWGVAGMGKMPERYSDQNVMPERYSDQNVGKINTFLIGNLLSLLFGISGGAITKYLLG